MTLLYIIAFIIIAIAITITTEIEYFGWTTLSLIGTVAAIQFFHLFNIWIYIKGHIFQSVIYTIAYITIGVVWSFAKWFFFLINSRDAARKSIEAHDKNGWAHNTPTLNIPQASHNKGRIIAWISYWPFSAIGTILNDPFRKLFNFIFNQFKNLYQRMANSIYKNDVDSLNIKVNEMQKLNMLEKQKLMEESVKLK